MPFDRTVKRYEPFAEGGDFGTAAAPARISRHDRALKHAVQSIDAEPAFAIGKAKRTAGADDRADRANSLDQGKIFRPERAAIGQMDLDGDMRRWL